MFIHPSIHGSWVASIKDDFQHAGMVEFSFLFTVSGLAFGDWSGLVWSGLVFLLFPSLAPGFFLKESLFVTAT